MTETPIVVGTVVSDQDTPTYELVRIKLKADQHLRPGTLVKIDTEREGKSTLIGRVRSAYEHNPNENPEDINVRDTLGIEPNYPAEQDSTTIYRLVEADLIEEIFSEDKKQKIRAPQTLPNSGADVYIANGDEIAFALGLVQDPAAGLCIGETVSGTITPIILKREVIQRHLFICGTTGSGKSYSMGVVVEELIKHHLPIVFIDTQDEYSKLVKKLGGKVLVPGKGTEEEEGFQIRISSLTDLELIDLIPTNSDLHQNIIAAAFLELQSEIKTEKRTKFLLQDLLDRINVVGPGLTNRADSVQLAYRRTQFLERMDIFGDGLDRANWPELMIPCLCINCKHLTSTRLQTVATAVLRELQDLRLRNFIPPYVAIIDEAHLFVPEGAGSACKQIIREGVRIGRHHGISMVLLTQSPVDIEKSVIRQCNTRMVFALEPDQLEAIKGVKADATEEMLRALPKMPQGTCLLSGTYESVKHSIPVKIRMRAVKDSEGGQTPDVFTEMKTKWLPKLDPS